MALGTLYSTIVAGNKIYGILSGFVDSFENEIEQIYLDMTNSHLASTEQCFETLIHSN